MTATTISPTGGYQATGSKNYIEIPIQREVINTDNRTFSIATGATGGIRVLKTSTYLFNYSYTVASPDFLDGNLLPGTTCDYIIYNIFARNSVNDTLSRTVSGYDALSGYYLTMSGSYIVSLNANDIVTIKTSQNSDNQPARTPYSYTNVILSAILLEGVLGPTGDKGNQGPAGIALGSSEYDIGIVCTDEVSNITTTGEKVSFRCPRQFTTTKIKSYLNSIGAGATGFRFSVISGPTGAATVVAQINQNNNLIVNTSNIYTYTEDSIISIRVDNVGAPATARGLKCYLIGNLS
jgi:hypothetical protein